METNLAIARLDKLSRNEDVQQKLQAPDCRWDLIVCDEAYKMSATVFSGETKYTKRYRLGQLLSTVTLQEETVMAAPISNRMIAAPMPMARPTDGRPPVGKRGPFQTRLVSVMANS